MPHSDPNKNQAYQKAYRERTRDKRLAYHKAYYVANRPELLAQQKAYRVANSEAVSDQNKAYREANREKISAQKKARHLENPNKNAARCKAYRDARPGENSARSKVYRRQRRAVDPGFKLLCNLRTRLNLTIVKGHKSARTQELLGCTIPELRAHLETRFRPGMTWENYGPVWHIDHIKPCAKFDLSDASQQKACFHYSNLQPLFAQENLRKGSKYEQFPQ